MAPDSKNIIKKDVYNALNIDEKINIKDELFFSKWRGIMSIKQFTDILYYKIFTSKEWRLYKFTYEVYPYNKTLLPVADNDLRQDKEPKKEIFLRKLQISAKLTGGSWKLEFNNKQQ